MNYNIKRICWCQKTYNGYTDSPYWEIEIEGNYFGLTDKGKLWKFNSREVSLHIKLTVQKIITECKLSIIIQE